MSTMSTMSTMPNNEQIPEPLSAVLKNGIVQVLTELNKDSEFKQMIAEKSLENAYSAIEDKAGKVGVTISNLRNLQKAIEKSESTDYDSLKMIVAKYNHDFNNIVGGGDQNMTGGSKKHYLFTRRRFSSRAFRKTRGRRRSSQ